MASYSLLTKCKPSFISIRSTRRRPSVQWLFLVALLFFLVLTSLVEKGTAADAAAMTTRSSMRVLQTTNTKKSTRRQFPECIQKKLSPKECKKFIEQVIKSEGGHEIGDNIKVKIRSSRTPDVMNDSYWMVEVPVNLDGKVACQINDAKTNYPFPWYYSGPWDVDPVDCLGLTAGECCLRVLYYGKTIGPKDGLDEGNNCLSCFAHQVPLSPISKNNGDETTYLSHVLLSEGNDSFFHPCPNGCSVVEYTSQDVDAYDATLIVIYEEALYRLHTIQILYSAENICNHSYDYFEQTLMALWNAAVTIPPLSQLIGKMTCRLCYGSLYDVEDISELEDDVINEILNLLRKRINKLSNYSSRDEHCIVIHTNADGDEIVKIPELPTIVKKEKDNSPIDPTKPCNEDIRVCAEGQYCSGERYYDKSYYPTEPLEYECRSYLQLGDPCDLWEYPGEYGILIPDICDPRVGYCKENPIVCDVNLVHFPPNTFPIPGTCTPYGKACTRHNRACDSKTEYCHIEGPSNDDDDVNNLIGRCETRIEKGLCCNPNSEQNICEYYSSTSSTASVQLECFPYIDFDYFLIGHACEVACKTDNECKAIDSSFTTCFMENFEDYSISGTLVEDGYGICQ